MAPADVASPADFASPADPASPTGPAEPATPAGRPSPLGRATARWRRAARTTDQSTEPASPEPATPAPPVVPEQGGTTAEVATDTDTDTFTGTGTGTGTGTDAESRTRTDGERSASTAKDDAEQPSRRGRLGLFRRNRPRVDEESRDETAAPEPMPSPDEEYVDWVAGLSKPVADNEPEQENGRRSLRATGRHHRD
ncbi:hypothetical protein GCM10027614_58210 [Micromonospora vulcania]